MHDSGNSSDQSMALKSLAAICEGFFDVPAILAGAVPLDAHELPPPARELLVHQEHMTLILERHYGEPVRLEVLEQHHDGDAYGRKIVLRPAGRNLVIEVGIARIDLAGLDQTVRREILMAHRPLGEILIAHDVLRRVDPRFFFRFTNASPVLDLFGPPAIHEAYGRMGLIRCNGRENIRLLEVIR